MKKIVLTESDITKIVKKSIEKKLNEDKFSVEPEISRQPRERDIDNLFGKYTYHVPDDVIRYMRKNPALIVKRLVDIYGEEKMRHYIDMASKPDEMEKRLDNPSLRDELDEDHSGDPNDMYVVKQNGDKWCVWEGNVKVKTFNSVEKAKEYADNKNEEQSLNEMVKRIISRLS